MEFYVSVMQTMIGVAAGLFIADPKCSSDKVWGLAMLVFSFALGFVEV